MTLRAGDTPTAATLPIRQTASAGRSAARRFGRGHPVRGRARLRRITAYLIISALAVFCVLPFGWVLLASVDARSSLYLRAPDLTVRHFVDFFRDPTTPSL